MLTAEANRIEEKINTNEVIPSSENIGKKGRHK